MHSAWRFHFSRYRLVSKTEFAPFGTKRGERKAEESGVWTDCGGRGKERGRGGGKSKLQSAHDIFSKHLVNVLHGLPASFQVSPKKTKK